LLVSEVAIRRADASTALSQQLAKQRHRHTL